MMMLQISNSDKTMISNTKVFCLIIAIVLLSLTYNPVHASEMSGLNLEKLRSDTRWICDRVWHPNVCRESCFGSLLATGVANGHDYHEFMISVIEESMEYCDLSGPSGTLHEADCIQKLSESIVKNWMKENNPSGDFCNIIEPIYMRKYQCNWGTESRCYY